MFVLYYSHVCATICALAPRLKVLCTSEAQRETHKFYPENDDKTSYGEPEVITRQVLPCATESEGQKQIRTLHPNQDLHEHKAPEREMLLEVLPPRL